MTGADLRPETGGTAAPFWDALAEGRLVLPYCQACDQAFFYPRTCCPRCWSERVIWIDSPGRGVLYAASVVYLPFEGVDASEVPYGVGLVDLDEGVRVAGRLPLGDQQPVAGDRVVAVFGKASTASGLEFRHEPQAGRTS
jgi:uncharacterized protein